MPCSVVADVLMAIQPPQLCNCNQIMLPACCLNPPPHPPTHTALQLPSHHPARPLPDHTPKPQPHPCRWYGYIKDYDGGTLMECSMQPHMQYARLPQVIREQRIHLDALLKSLTSNHVTYQGLQRTGPGYPGAQQPIHRPC